MDIPSGMTATTVFYLLALIFLSSRSSRVKAIAGAEVENHHVINVTPTVIVESVPFDGVVRCERVPIYGLSRLNLRSYSSARRVSMVPSKGIKEKSYSKIQICLHSNSSLGWCHCEKDKWESIQNEIWSSVISPYLDKYIDVKFSNNLYGSVTVSVKEEFHRWRLLNLAIGFILLLLAPIVSSWVPFYYSSSMAIGICLLVIFILFQGMKLLPTGRNNALYSTICGLALGAFLLNRLSIFVNSILVNFGFDEEMHNPVLVFLAVGIVLIGAGFGYWLVRKFVVSQDGSIDAGVSQFVKWALRVIALTFIFQSTLDSTLAMGLLVSFLAIYLYFTSMHGRPRATHSRGTLWESSSSVSPCLNCPAKGIQSPYACNARNPSTYYSTFHKTPDRKKSLEEKWKELADASSRQAVVQWVSPEPMDRIMKNAADRIQLLYRGDSSEESVGSGSDSTDDNISESSSMSGIFDPIPRKRFY